MPTSILIIAGDTDGNLGDLAIVTATVGELRRIEPGATVSIVSSRLNRDQARLDVNVIRRGVRGLKSLLRAARSADLIVCGGGGLFQDDDSLVKMPYWAARLLLINQVSGPIVGFSIGVGPLNFRVSRWFARLALKQLEHISVRDGLAQAVLTPLTSKRIEIVPDPAFLLQAASPEAARAALLDVGVPVGDVPLVGVAVRRWFHKKSQILPHKYAQKIGLRKSLGQAEMAAFIAHLTHVLDEVGRQTGAHVVFLPTYNVSHESDIDVCRIVADKLTHADSSVLNVEDPCLYKAITGHMSVMLCGRMHPAILAAGQRTPIVGLAYNQKFAGTFALLRQEHRCISIDEFVAAAARRDQLLDLLVGSIHAPESSRPEPSAIEKQTRSHIASLLSAQTAPGAFESRLSSKERSQS